MKKRVRGLSLIELLVALAIGSMLIAGAVLVYSQSRKTYTISDTVARLQENARYALSLIEQDVQLAGYYGFSNAPHYFSLITGGTPSSPIPAVDMQTSSTAVTVTGIPHDCGTNFAIDLVAAIEGSDDTYGLACAAQGGGALAGADTLTIRRASTSHVAPTNGRLQLVVNRLSPPNQYVIVDGQLPQPAATAVAAGKTEDIQVRDLIVRTYYVSQKSLPNRNVPALRVKSLVAGAFADEEIMSGVEDLQVQFGIDTGDYDNVPGIDPGMDLNGDGIPDSPNGIATRYVSPKQLEDDFKGFQVVSVRLWLRMRAEQPEVGFVDNKTYTYAGRPAFTPNDGFRRVLVSRTIQLRNTRTF